MRTRASRGTSIAMCFAFARAGSIPWQISNGWRKWRRFWQQDGLSLGETHHFAERPWLLDGFREELNPSCKLDRHQKALDGLAGNATVGHQFEPCAARLRKDQPHLLAASHARHFRHPEVHAGGGGSGWLQHVNLAGIIRGHATPTNVLILPDSRQVS